VVNLLRDLQRRLGVALLFIAHDLSVVRHVSDRVAVMYLGRIAEYGETPSLFTSPAHPYTGALLSASPVVDRERRGRMASRVMLVGDPPSPASPPAGCRFHTRCPAAQPRCSIEVPVLRHPQGDRAPERVAACHFAEDVLAGHPPLRSLELHTAG
jgi:oligopeptide transport system ATP-binding protein